MKTSISIIKMARFWRLFGGAMVAIATIGLIGLVGGQDAHDTLHQDAASTGTVLAWTAGLIVLGLIGLALFVLMRDECVETRRKNRDANQRRRTTQAMRSTRAVNSGHQPSRLARVGTVIAQRGAMGSSVSKH